MEIMPNPGNDIGKIGPQNIQQAKALELDNSIKKVSAGWENYLKPDELFNNKDPKTIAGANGETGKLEKFIQSFQGFYQKYGAENKNSFYIHLQDGHALHIKKENMGGGSYKITVARADKDGKNAEYITYRGQDNPPLVHKKSADINVTAPPTKKTKTAQTQTDRPESFASMQNKYQNLKDKYNSIEHAIERLSNLTPNELNEKLTSAEEWKTSAKKLKGALEETIEFKNSQSLLHRTTANMVVFLKEGLVKISDYQSHFANFIAQKKYRSIG